MFATGSARLAIVGLIVAMTSGVLAGARASSSAAMHVAAAFVPAAVVPPQSVAPAAPPVRMAQPPSPRPAPVQATRIVSEHRSMRTALIVGVNDQDPNRPALGAATDAGYLRDALLAHGFRAADMTVLVNGAATRRSVLYELGRLSRRTAPGGLAVVGISTHASGSSFRTGDGSRVSVSELAARVGVIPGTVWTIMAVCYAGRFAVPGVTGPRRIGTFSSDANHLSFEKGSTGSDFFYYMIELGMLKRAADGSVEQAFDYAQLHIEQDGSSPPVMSDGTAGEVVLGPRT